MKLPDIIIPKVPAGSKPFLVKDLCRQRIKAKERITISLYDIGYTLCELEAILKGVKEKAAATLNCTVENLPEIEMDTDGQEYEGLDSLVFTIWEYETDAQAIERLNKIVKNKQAYIDKKANKPL